MKPLLYAAGIAALLTAPLAARAQVAVGIGIGPEVVYPAYEPVDVAPSCAYGYYGYYPYDCAPEGFYGPDWFLGGAFIGAGPFYHGFYGYPWGFGFSHIGYGYYGGFGRGFYGGYGYRGGYGYVGYRGGDGG